MSRDETKQLLAILRAAYPNFYKDQYGAAKSKEEWSAVINIWSVAMADFEYGFIANGFKRLVQTNKFPPTPADVIEAAQQSAMDWLAVTSCEQYGGTLPTETWLFISGRAVQYGEWRQERQGFKEALDANDSRDALPPRKE